MRRDFYKKRLDKLRERLRRSKTMAVESKACPVDGGTWRHDPVYTDGDTRIPTAVALRGAEDKPDRLKENDRATVA